MRTRYLLAAILTLLLLADVGWNAWSERPYVVTGYSWVLGTGGGVVSVQYRVPGGHEGEWRAPAGYQQTRDCWEQAHIGKAIPRCMRSAENIRRDSSRTATATPPR
jgi:hypothetical protein